MILLKYWCLLGSDCIYDFKRDFFLIIYMYIVCIVGLEWCDVFILWNEMGILYYFEFIVYIMYVCIVEGEFFLRLCV